MAQALALLEGQVRDKGGHERIALSWDCRQSAHLCTAVSEAVRAPMPVL